jgi:hypothetical protein
MRDFSDNESVTGTGSGALNSNAVHDASKRYGVANTILALTDNRNQRLECKSARQSRFLGALGDAGQEITVG